MNKVQTAYKNATHKIKDMKKNNGLKKNLIVYITLGALLLGALGTLVSGGLGGALAATGPTTITAKCNSFTVDYTTIKKGGEVYVAWETTGATSIENNFGANSAKVDSNGGHRIGPIFEDKTYFITPVDEKDRKGERCEIKVDVIDTAKTATCTLSSDKRELKAGENIRLSWITNNATSIRTNFGADESQVGANQSFATKQGVYEDITYKLIPVNNVGHAGTPCTIDVKVTDKVDTEPSEPEQPEEPIVITKATCNIGIDGSSKVKAGTDITLLWTTSNTNYIESNFGLASNNLNSQGGYTVHGVANNYDYTITPYNENGKGTPCVAKLIVEEKITAKPSYCYELSTSKKTVLAGETFKLAWSTEEATMIETNIPGVEKNNINGTANISTQITTKYYVTPINFEGVKGTTCNITIEVVGKAACNISVDGNSTVESGTNIVLLWTTSNTDYIKSNFGLGSKSLNSNGGYTVHGVANDYDYTITPYNKLGVPGTPCVASIKVTTKEVTKAPTATCVIKSDRTEIMHGQSILLSWITDDATSIRSNFGASSSKLNSWGHLINGAANYNYTVTPINADGVEGIPCSVRINVR